jgi:hypothetical protein
MLSLSSAKLPWLLAMVASAIYFVLFYIAATGPQEKFPDYNYDGLMGGFCVWGAPVVPDNAGGCITAHNSHVYAWYEDFIMTLFVVGAYFCSSKKQQEQLLTYIAIGGIVFLHGFLHFCLYTFLDPSCVISADAPAGQEEGSNDFLGWTAYIVFTFFLCLIIFYLGFAKQKGILKVLVLSVVVTFVTILLAIKFGHEWLLTALFATSHPVGSITGFKTTSPLFSRFVGWFFLLATIDGIVELMACEAFLKPYGGHIWYDLFLHTAVIAALPIFVDTPSKKNTD